MKILIGILLYMIINFNLSYGARYQARVYSGGFVSREEFKEKSDGAYRNDIARLSGRMFLSSSQLFSERIGFVSDVRDRYDFFDKVDKAKLELTDGNKLQVRQLSGNYMTKNKGFKLDLGRFPVAESGNAAYTDGVHLKFQLRPSFSTGVFGGLNPKRPDQTYLQFNKNSQTAGAYFDIVPKYSSWNKNFALTNAFFVQQNDKDIDRSVWYQNMIYQWNENNRVYSIYYLDFVPRTYFQFLNASYWSKITEKLSLTPSVLAVDVIEYTRRQGVRDRLTPSYYREVNLDGKYKFNKYHTFEMDTSYGIRQADKKIKTEVFAGSVFSNLINKRFSFYLKLGYRDNFMSEDYVSKFGVGYYRKQLELNFDEELSLEKRAGVTDDVPSISDLSLSYYFSNAIYGSFSLQYAKDRMSNITSGFVKFGYRFGNESIPALRDGAPPLGKI